MHLADHEEFYLHVLLQDFGISNSLGTLAAIISTTKLVNSVPLVDLVTETDKACEDLIFNHLRQHYPKHKLIGEETTAACGTTELTDEPTWIVDPLDGTTNFVHGIIKEQKIMMLVPDIGIAASASCFSFCNLKALLFVFSYLNHVMDAEVTILGTVPSLLKACWCDYSFQNYCFPMDDACKPSQGFSNPIFTRVMSVVMGIVTMVRLTGNMPRKLTDATLYSSSMCRVAETTKGQFHASC
ncbi:hypothetical protein F0562_009430 [Nyssa sinensis]|uniref:Inositol-phosphate phosphatase n=1 Tax=Nyssa sinensis TaxID=561372 RepID=A0A5J5A0Y2_9ASTE|nr:hypothetical protein F0562_009430 [Nyssa sinensis]